jgi:hypothetical protein
MNETDFQLFLTLMDTCHDYGNTARADKVLSKILDESNTTEETNATNVNNTSNSNSTSKKAFNPAFLIDFLMLGYTHKYFRKILGLEEYQHYISKKSDCTSLTKYNESKTYIKNDDISKKICQKFYYPTYAERVIFRSVKPEVLTKAILLDYLATQRNMSYIDDETVFDLRSQMTKPIPKTKTLTLVLGQKSKFKGKNKKINSNGLSGIFTHDSTQQPEIFHSILSEYFEGHVVYVTDANKIDNEWICFHAPQSTYYEGKFVEYDSFKQNITQGTQHIDGFDFDDSTSCSKTEFQQYSLSRQNGELLVLDTLGVRENNYEFELIQEVNNIQYIISTNQGDSKNDPRGLTLFLLLFNEINKKTLGFKVLNKSTKIDLKKKIESVGLAALRRTYKITLDIDDDSTGNYTKLPPEQFILALFDLKRSMDYLYVKACAEANKKEKDGRRFVFVSSDRSAICYSLMLDNPCILTPPVSSSGLQKVLLYNPQARQSNSLNSSRAYNSKNISKNNVNFYKEVEEEELNRQRLDDINEQKELMNAVDIARTIAFENIGQVAREIDVLPEISLSESILTLNHKQCKSFLNAYNDSSKTKVGHPLKNQGVRGRKPQYDKDDPEIASIKQYCEQVLSIKPIDKDAVIMQYIQNLKTNKNSRKEDPKKQIKCSQDDINCVLTELERKYSISKVEFCEFIKNNKTSNPIVRELLKSNILNYKEICNTVGISVGGGISHTSNRVLLEEIPLVNLETICENGSPFHIFLSFYSQLSPTINFFWFITYKTLFFMMFGDDMDRADCVRYQKMYSPIQTRNTPKKQSNIQTNVSMKEQNTLVSLMKKSQSQLQSQSKLLTKLQQQSQSIKPRPQSLPTKNNNTYFEKGKRSSNGNGFYISTATLRDEPSQSAASLPIGTIKQGNDGNMYIVKTWEKGRGKPSMWFRLQNTEKQNAIPNKLLRQSKMKNEENANWKTVINSIREL